MGIKMLTLVLRLENLFCVFRNYYFFTRKHRIITNIRSLLEIAFMLISVYLLLYLSQLTKLSSTVTFSLSIINSLMTMVSARWYARPFKRLLDYININHNYFSQDKIYLKALEKHYTMLKVLAFCYGLIGVSLFVFRRLDSEVTFERFIKGQYAVFFTNVILLNARYYIEYVVFYAVLVVLTEHVRCLSRRIQEDVEVYEKDEGRIEEHSMRMQMEKFEQWTKIYTNVKEGSNLFNHIFGVQGACGTTPTILFYSLKFFLYILALFMLSRSAFELRSSADWLRRDLVKLLIYCPIDQPSHRATKDLLRLVATRTLCTRAYGSLPIDMTLLPSSVMLFTSYTVIALQFNNVV
ncbi:unnamed protein product [Leptosia nina]|uniref:Gustatory receptor n=1 Tax=Leptosia nina TaxID=320188 RepID=A0AAV1JCC4_9NEOP